MREEAAKSTVTPVGMEKVSRAQGLARLGKMTPAQIKQLRSTPEGEAEALRIIKGGR